jgi:hypothetical protein
LWTEAPDKKDLTRGGRDTPIEPETVAEAMLELCENPEYGNGTILEVSVGQQRLVPLYNADPPPAGSIDMPNVLKSWVELVERLQRDGLDV